MKRKVIKQGNGTLTITLPKGWTEKTGLKGGDEINIEETDGMVCVSAEKGFTPKKISIEISKLDKSVLDSLLAVLHKSGYDEIELTFDEPKLVKIIQKRINSMLIGYEIIEQTNKRCIIKSIASQYDSNIDDIIRRIFLVTLSLAQNTLDVMKSGDLSNIDELMVLEETNNKLTNLCHRILNKKPTMGAKTVYLYIVVWLLESIADDYRDICKVLSEKKTKPKFDKATMDIYGKIMKLLEHLYHLFYNFDLEEMKMIRQEHKDIVGELNGMMGSKNQDAFIMNYMFSITQRIYDCFGSVTGMHF